jgi:MOSC domain-containing protein YiiM
MPKEGIFAEVINDGRVAAGDEIVIEKNDLTAETQRALRK